MSESERIAGRILDECFADYAAAFWFDRHAAASVIKSEFSSLRTTLTARESELAEAKRRVAELESKLAQSTNYVADDEIYPHVVWFANGRSVRIASGGHLTVGFERPPGQSQIAPTTDSTPL